MPRERGDDGAEERDEEGELLSGRRYITMDGRYLRELFLPCQL